MSAAYAMDYGLYVLVKDSAGNRRRGAQAPISAFARGEGMTLDGIARRLYGIGRRLYGEVAE